MYQYPDYLMHYGIPGMKWGVHKQRTYDTSTAYGRMKTAKQQYKSAKKEARLDRKDEKYIKNHVWGYDLASKQSRKKAGKEIDASDKAWRDYINSMNVNGKTHPKSIKAYKTWQKASADMMTKLASDVQLPSGRKMKYIADAIGTHGSKKYYEFV